jgi:hypothetical protein
MRPVEYGHVTYTCTWPRTKPTSRSRHIYKVSSTHLPFYKKSIKILPYTLHLYAHVHPFNKTPITIRHIHYKNARKDALDYHILITLLCKVPCRVAAMWVQGSSDVTTSWSGLVALPAPDYYNGHPLLTTYKTCYEAYISLNGEVNALGYFNLAVIVHSRPGVIGATRYKKTPKLKVAPIRALSRFIYVRPRRVTRM